MCACCTVLYRAPFDIAIVCLAFQSVCMYTMWTENFGNESSEVVGSIVSAINVIVKGTPHSCPHVALYRTAFSSANRVPYAYVHVRV